MSLRRYNPRRDASEGDIVDALETYGFSVQRLSARGVPDLLIGKDGISRPAEVKTGNKPLNADQLKWWRDWRGSGCIVLRTVDDVPRLALAWSLTDRRLLEFLAQS